jgi:hypothetical protein
MVINSNTKQKKERVDVVVQCYSMVKLPSAEPEDQGT